MPSRARRLTMRYAWIYPLGLDVGLTPEPYFLCMHASFLPTGRVRAMLPDDVACIGMCSVALHSYVHSNSGHTRFQWFLKSVGECDKTLSWLGGQQTNTELRHV